MQPPPPPRTNDKSPKSDCNHHYFNASSSSSSPVKSLIKTLEDASISLPFEAKETTTQKCVEKKASPTSIGFLRFQGYGVNLIVPGLYLSGQNMPKDSALLSKHQITHILNLTTNIENHFESTIVYKRIKMQDTLSQDLAGYFADTFDFIDSTLRSDANNHLLVHCNAGVSRSASIVIAYLMQKSTLGTSSYQAAYEHVKKCRPIICPNANFVKQLKALEARLIEQQRQQQQQHQKTFSSSSPQNTKMSEQETKQPTSLLGEISTFQRATALKPCSTRVTYLNGRQFVKESLDADEKEVADPVDVNLSYVYDNAIDLNMDEIVPGLYLSADHAAVNKQALGEKGITHIVNVTTNVDNRFESEGSIAYMRLRIYDECNEDIGKHFESTFRFIDDALANNGNNRVLVHCNMGISRSASIVIAYLLQKNLFGTYEEAYKHTKAKRPRICPNDGFKKHLISLQTRLLEANGGAQHQAE